MGQLLLVQKMETVSEETPFHIVQEKWTLKSPSKITLGIHQVPSTPHVFLILSKILQTTLTLAKKIT